MSFVNGYFTKLLKKTKNGIKMQSIEGSAWINLTFSIDNDRQRAIDEYGMTELNKISSNKDSNLADFLFTIQKLKTELSSKELKELRGLI